MQMRGPEVVVTGAGHRHLKNSHRPLRVKHLLTFRLPVVIVIRVKMIGFGIKVHGKEARQPQHVYTTKDTKAGESDHMCYSEHLVVQKGTTIYLS